jgi:hypothetical protein
MPDELPENVVEVAPHIISAIDRIVKKADPKKISPNKRIETDKDWDLVMDIYYYWRTLFPQEYGWFIEGVEDLREQHQFNKGISDEKDGAKLQHVMEMPQLLWGLIVTAFPEEKMEEGFRDGFIKRLPEFKVS